VIELGVDASVVLKWIQPARERYSSEAESLWSAYEEGRAAFVAPPLLFLEVMNVAARGWKWAEPTLLDLAERLQAFRIEVVEPALPSVASWAARGLTAYDAAYVALAADRGVPLVTDDREILEVAPEVARPLTGFHL